MKVDFVVMVDLKVKVEFLVKATVELKVGPWLL